MVYYVELLEYKCLHKDTLNGFLATISKNVFSAETSSESRNRLDFTDTAAKEHVYLELIWQTI